jgi:hypothetical protein
MERRIARLAACIVMLAWFALPSAQAEAPTIQTQVADAEPPEYRHLIDDALDEYEARNFAEARALFMRAHAIMPSARTSRGLGMVEFELKSYRDSVLRLEAALASPVKRLEGPLRSQTEELLARAKMFVAQFKLHTVPEAPPELRVSINGEVWTLEADQTLTLPVGEHVLVVKARGYADAKRTLSVKGAEQSDLFIELHPDAVAVASGPTDPLKPTSDKPDKPLYKNPWLWSGVGAVVVGGIVAAVVLSMRKDKSNNTDYPDAFASDVGVGGQVQTLVRAR